jgi:hypothetical protein
MMRAGWSAAQSPASKVPAGQMCLGLGRTCEETDFDAIRTTYVATSEWLHLSNPLTAGPAGTFLSKV